MPSDRPIEYRYLICSQDPQTEQIHIRQWETHIEARIAPVHNKNVSEENVDTTDTYGLINDVEKIDRGWLTSETIVQFKFFNNPFKLKDRIKNKILYVKVSFRRLFLNLLLIRIPFNLTIFVLSNRYRYFDNLLSSSVPLIGVQPDSISYTDEHNKLLFCLIKQKLLI